MKLLIAVLLIVLGSVSARFGRGGGGAVFKNPNLKSNENIQDTVKITLPHKNQVGSHDHPENRVWKVQAGANLPEAKNANAMVTDFFPNYIQARKGDTIEFSFMSLDPHVVIFGAAYETYYPLISPALFSLLTPIPSSGQAVFDGSTVVNSGLMFQPNTWSLMVNAPPGVYRYRCLVHPAMIGYLEVVAGKPENAHDVGFDNTINKMYTNIANWMLNAAMTEAWVVGQTPSAFGVGSTTADLVFVNVGIGHNSVSLMQFVPNSITISSGTTVRFVNSDALILHTVTMGSDDSYGPEGLNPVGVNPNGPTVITSIDQLYNSGWLNPNWGAIIGQPQQPYYVDVIFDFDQPQSVTIYCSIHVTIGMSMVVNVN